MLYFTRLQPCRTYQHRRNRHDHHPRERHARLQPHKPTQCISSRLLGENRPRETKSRSTTLFRRSARASHRDGDSGQEEEHRVAARRRAEACWKAEAGAHARYVLPIPELQLLLRLGVFIHHRSVLLRSLVAGA